MRTATKKPVTARGSLAFADSDLLEGTEDSRREAGEARRRQARVIAARRFTGWREYQRDDLTPHGRFLATAAGDLLRPYRASPFVEQSHADGSNRADVMNAGSATAFYLSEAGDVVVLEPAPFPTVELLGVRLAQRSHARKDADLHAREQQIRKRAADREYRAAQPLRPVLLADLHGRELPTVAQAARLIIDHGGTITAKADRIHVDLPERLAPKAGADRALRAELLDCVRVLAAARDIVLPAVSSRSTKPLPDRLPDTHVLADGGLDPR
jgi:hypothetical protein